VTAQAAGASGAGFRNPALTVDGVVFAGGGQPRVLLIERGGEPFRGAWALPGGFVDYGEDIDAAVVREIAEETGLPDPGFRQFRTYGRPDRDPRGHTVSVVYVARLAGPPPAVAGGDDAARAAWHPLDALPELAFDHARILADVLDDPRHRP